MTRRRPVLDVVFLDGFRAARSYMWFTLALALVSGVAQATFPLGFKIFVDAAADRSTGGLVVATALMAALTAVYWTTGTLDANVGFGLVDRMEVYVSTRIARLVTSVPTLKHLTDPDYLRQLDLLVEHKTLMRDAPRQTLTALTAAVRLVAMVVLLVMIHPVLVLVPLAGALPTWAQSRSVAIRQRAEERTQDDDRLEAALFTVATSASAAGELRVYGLAADLERRHATLAERTTRTLDHAAFLGAVLVAAAWALFVVVAIGAVGLVVDRAVAGSATAGDVVLAIILVQQLRELLATAITDLGSLMTAARSAQRAGWLDAYATTEEHAGGAEPPTRIREGIRLDDVGFTYPNQTKPALRDVSLLLPAGACVALVGENGAGKSTLLGLLCALYEPTVGQISIDDTCLADCSPPRWQALLSGAFQDHVPFELRAGESVGIGDLPRHDDREAVGRALDRAGSGEVVAALDAGLDTPLGHSFADGQQLSGGQWRRLALGRAMMRDEPLLLILDEPTASLDAAAEHTLFERYFAAARRVGEESGAITIVVTHRLATAASADLIVSMDDGTVVEVGSHDELMAAGGGYAEVFALQARGYR